jgi:predicted nuclease of predicted toxin-antitoxin system
MRFLLDEHLSKALARYLTRSGHDVLRVVDAGLRGASDTELLVWAATHGRVMVTRDADFLNDIRFPPENFAGIIVLQVADASPTGTIAAMKPVLATLTDPNLSGTLVIIDDAGMRLRPER